MNNDAIVNSILQNPSAHRVNRAEKMSKSVDVHVSNINKKIEQGANGSAKEFNEAFERGYGTGGRQSD